MTTLRLLFASLTFCFFFISQTNAQVIRNNTTCVFEVKANIIPLTTCGLTGAGPFFPTVNPNAVIPINLPSSPATHWVPAYGVGRLGLPTRVPGDTPFCGYMATNFVGLCGGFPAFATYDPITDDLDIHF